MGKIFRDLDKNLDKDIFLREKTKKNYVQKIGTKNSNDISRGKRNFIELRKQKKIFLKKEKNSNFDSIKKADKNQKLIYKKNISLIRKIRTFFEKQYLLYKMGDKKFLVIIIIIVIFILYIVLSKIIIENSIGKSVKSLERIKTNFISINQSKKELKSSKFYLKISYFLIKPYSILASENIKNVENIILGIIYAQDLLLEGFKIYEKIQKEFDKNTDPYKIDLLELTQQIKENYENLYLHSYNSLKYFSKVGDLGSDNLNEKLFFTKEKLKQGLIFIKSIVNNYNTFLSILGDHKDKNYLIIFQNNDEIRASGGFMGSTQIVSIKNGKIINTVNKDIYALEWDLHKNYKEKKSPFGIDRVSKTFGLRDANYLPLIKDSAKSIKFFLDKTNYKIDGIIFINQNLVLDLLDLIDGVYSKDLDKNINSKNFSLIMSSLVEGKIFKKGTLSSPKDIIFNFSKDFKKKLIQEKKYYDYLKIILKYIKTRDIVFYSFDSGENYLLWKLGLNGEIRFLDSFDFNYVVFNSIGGNKTDRYINYKFDKIIKTRKDTCDYDIRLDIYKSHHFSKQKELELESILKEYNIKNYNEIKFIQGKETNESFVSILLPKDSIIDLSPGLFITDEKNYKKVDFFSKTQRLQTSLNSIKYTLKNPFCKKYDFIFYKQAGIKKYDLNINFNTLEERFFSLESDFKFKEEDISN